MHEVKPTSQRPGSISISTPIVTSSPTPIYETKPSSTSQPEVILDVKFTNDELEIAWLQFSDIIQDQVRMKSFILNTKPELISENKFEIKVSNQSQEKELLKLEKDLIPFLRAHLKNSNVEMQITMAVESESQRNNSPEDRYRILAEQNPALDILKNGLMLEID